MRKTPSVAFALSVIVLIAAAFAPLTGCDSPRKKECAQLLDAMKPLEQGVPTADTVDQMSADVDSMQFQDLPLGIYAKNFRTTLAVLSNILKLKDSPSAPDSTDDVIKAKLKEARAAKDDAARYCAK
jgi:hypothetical protein